MGRGVRLLLVDADPERRSQTQATLEATGPVSAVTTAPASDRAIERLGSEAVDCMVSALDVGTEDVVSFLQRVRMSDESVPFVLFAAEASAECVGDVYEFDRTDYVMNVPGATEALATRAAEMAGATGAAGETPTQSQELARERERFSDLFSNFPEPTVAYGIDDGVTVFKAVNDAFEIEFGREEQAVRNKSVNELIVPDDARTESQEIDTQVDSGDMVDRVVRRNAADGTRIFNLRSIPVSASGEIDGFAVYSDITERKRRESELERYETIVETIPMGVLTVDDDWTIQNINAPGAEILGYSVDELLGQPLTTLGRDGVITEEMTDIADDITAGLQPGSESQKEIVELQIHPGPDQTREIEVHASLLPADEVFSGVVLVFHDITERKQNERELRRQNERLEEFASIVSHDLRNPLNVAMGHLEIIQDNHDSPSVQHVAGALDRMETLIRETLQLAKQGEMVTETEPIQLSSILNGCWGMIAGEEATLEQTGDVQFEGDPPRVKQLFENLFRNAIDHAGEDVTVRVGYEGGTLTVADDGPGVPPDQRDEVFDTGHTTSDDGTGFGLAIVQEIVDAHDWEITVSESWAGGARFEITGFDVVES
ncbi:PAS domain S-box-containing protein [Halovenus aranensis]|uniref:histidine kinase n=1 Tax=Halovenus aranensis TaxID=890420 RepID=A0A1G8VC81_9EURY|nr:PAS domain S-box protein [Halovenus aranensis]SDJ63559.1 PAS domain S-box-containing protein [Halovenus aranensis]